MNFGSVESFGKLRTSSTQILKESSGNGLGFENGPNKVGTKKYIFFLTNLPTVCPPHRTGPCVPQSTRQSTIELAELQRAQCPAAGFPQCTYGSDTHPNFSNWEENSKLHYNSSARFCVDSFISTTNTHIPSQLDSHNPYATGSRST